MIGVGGQAVEFAIAMEQLRARCYHAGLNPDRVLEAVEARAVTSPLPFRHALQQVWREATADPEDWT